LKQNEAISNKVDRLKDMVSDRLSEVEVKVNKLFTLGASSEESMRSLAESVSHLKKHFGTFPGTVTVTAPALDAFPWACDAITGIDDAFSRDPVKGMSRCIYCRRVFVWEDLESPARLGRHLVDRHAFGKCNLNVAYKMWEELEDHLANFHSSTPGLKKDRFLRKRLQDPSVLQLDDSLTHPSQGPSADEVTARSLLLLTILEDKLRECGIELLVGRDASSEQRSHHVCSAMARLDLLYRDSMLKSRPPKSVQRLLYEAACIEEEIVLSGDLETLRFSSLYSSDQTFLHQSSSKPSLHGLLYQIEPRWYCDVAKLKKFRLRGLPLRQAVHFAATLPHPCHHGAPARAGDPPPHARRSRRRCEGNSAETRGQIGWKSPGDDGVVAHVDMCQPPPGRGDAPHQQLALRDVHRVGVPAADASQRPDRRGRLVCNAGPQLARKLHTGALGGQYRGQARGNIRRPVVQEPAQTP